MDRDDLIDYFEWLDDLRQSGTENMFGAGPLLCREFPILDREEARAVLKLWFASDLSAPMGERIKSALAT